MKINTSNLLRTVSGLALGLALMVSVANAQQTSASAKTPDESKDKKAVPSKTPDKKPAKKTEDTPTSATTGEDAGNFTVTSTIELGYRGQRVDGDVNKFKSDLNYKAGPRLFDTTFLMKSKNGGKGELFDTLLVTSTGWGADPYGNLRISAESPKWYRFEGTYRRFKYYRFLDNFANPTWLFTPNPTVANPVTGLHGYNTNTQMGDFDLTILPKNETIRFNIGYSPERYSGPSFTNYHNGGNDFWLLSNNKSRANDFRFGADGKVGPIDWTFVQGFRRFRDDSTITGAFGLNSNTPTTGLPPAQLSSFLRQEPTRGKVDFTRASIHTLVAKKLDITGRIVYSKTTSNSLYTENFTGFNFNTRITGFPPTVTGASATNTLNPSFYNIAGSVKRPNTVGDIGVTFLATDKFRLSNTFRVEDFTIDGIATFADFFSLTRTLTGGGSRTDTISFSNLSAFKSIHYRKFTETFEGDYQFNPKYSVHFGYRYGNRREHQTLTGYALNSSAPALLNPACVVPSVTCAVDEIETNHTNAFFAGFKARPVKNWTLYFDGEHGTADNVFTRIGNYNYTNIRAKSRYAPNRKVNFNLGLIIRNNANPSEIAGTSLSDFGVSLKTRTFQSSVDWLVNPKFSVSMGYNYSWVNSDSTIDYLYQVPPAAAIFHHLGHALYFQRNNYFYFDATARLNKRMTLYSSYRINQDNGQGNRLSDPAGGTTIAGGYIPPYSTTAVAANLGGTMITSYPMNFTSPEARLAIKLNRRLDWNLGYQYFAYNETKFFLNTFPGSPRAQNYHAHLPYMSLRLYIGRKE